MFTTGHKARKKWPVLGSMRGSGPNAGDRPWKTHSAPFVLPDIPSAEPGPVPYSIIIHKRGRGRPRKYPRPGEPLPIYVPLDPPPGETQKKKRPGRPQRQVSESEIDAIVLTDFEQQHFDLEVIEHRIQGGDDIEHGHPAMSISALAQFDRNFLSYREKRLKMNYKSIEMPEPRPSFWEARVYDIGTRRPDESERLRLKIADLQREVNTIRRRTRRYVSDADGNEEESDGETRSVGASPMRRTHVRTRALGPPANWDDEKPIMVKIAVRDFGTDDSEPTEWDDA